LLVFHIIIAPYRPPCVKGAVVAQPRLGDCRICVIPYIEQSLCLTNGRTPSIVLQREVQSKLKNRLSFCRTADL
jgi:hypothetical protein